MKIRRRFDVESIAMAPCLAVVPDVSRYPILILSLPSSEQFGFLQHVTQLLSYIGNNHCNVTYLPDGLSGYRLDDGNYTGMLGMAQRQVIRPASVRDDIVKLTPVFLPTELQVIVSHGKGTTDTNDVMNVFLNVHTEALVSFVILWYISTALVVFAAVSSKTRFGRVKLRQWIPQWIDKLWHFAVTVVDQECLTSSSWPVRFVWVSCCLAIFVVMFGILLNLIQTDGVVEQPPKTVERFYDLIHEREFQDVHVMIFTALHFYNYLVTAAKGTMASILYSRMAKTDNCSYGPSVKHCNFLEFKLSDSLDLVSHVTFLNSNFIRNQKGLLVDKSYLDNGLSQLACISVPGLLVNVRGSNDFLVADYGTLFYSKTVNIHLMKYMNFRLQSLMEADIIRRKLREIVDTLDVEVPAENKFKRFRCMHGMTDGKATDAPPALDVKKLRKTMVACFSLLAASLVVLAMETWARF